MRDAADHRDGPGVIGQPSRFVGLILFAGLLALGYGFTADGMIRPGIGPALLIPVIVWLGAAGSALLAFPERTGWLIGPVLLSGYPVWIAAGHAIYRPELMLTPSYLIFILAPLAALGSTRLFLVAVAAVIPALTIGLWGQYPTDLGLALRVVGDGLELIMVSVAVFVLSRRHERLAGRLHDLAGSDPLTQLPNRRRLDEVATTFLRSAQDAGTLVAVLILDLDHFKQINDTHGHSVGDQVLVSVSGDIAALLGPHAVLARTGGEELLILTVLSSPAEADALGERVRALVAGGSSPVPLTCSMGIAAVAPPASRMDAAQAAGWLWAVAGVADQAMYDAKHAGRNRVVRAATTFVPQPPPRAVPARVVTAAPAVRPTVTTAVRALSAAVMGRRPSPPVDTAGRLHSVRLGGGIAIVTILLVLAVERSTALLAPGPVARAMFVGIVVHGLGVGVLGILRPQLLSRFVAMVLVFACLSWAVAPAMYSSPDLLVSPVQLIMICGIGALVTGSRGLVAVLLAALSSLWIALSHNHFLTSELAGQVVINGACLLASTIGIHLLRIRNERVQQRLQLLSMTDPLTRLPNRRHVQDSAGPLTARAAAEGRQLAALLIDLDRFKDFNDTHGHAVGDEVLLAVSAAILARLGPGDLLARAGGEEFLLLSVVTGLDTASGLAEQVRQAVEAMPGGLSVTCSIGVSAATPDDGLTSEGAAEWVWTLTGAADRAMYQAKLAGRNRVVTIGSAAGTVPEQTRRTIRVRPVRSGGTIG